VIAVAVVVSALLIALLAMVQARRAGARVPAYLKNKDE